MSLRIIKAGFQTTIQDLGRWGFQSQGVPVSGAMDEDSFALANVLTGNDYASACLEVGPAEMQIGFEVNSLIALCGKGHAAFVENERISFNKTVLIRSGTVLSLKPEKGIWSYLAVGGGFDMDKVLNSRSTYQLARFGGMQGRALRAGDGINFSNRKSLLTRAIERSLPLDGKSSRAASWSVPQINLNTTDAFRIVKSLEWDWLDKSSQKHFLNKLFVVSNDCSRMGYRLNSEPLLRGSDQEMISSAVTKGSIQLTHEGNLIVLMADGQTVGGYPRIGQVAAVDIGRLAQKKPGETIRVASISFGEAERLFLFREQWRDDVRRSVEAKFL